MQETGKTAPNWVLASADHREVYFLTHGLHQFACKAVVYCQTLAIFYRPFQPPLLTSWAHVIKFPRMIETANPKKASRMVLYLTLRYEYEYLTLLYEYSTNSTLVAWQQSALECF